ncbi:hypothetical protein wNo_10300 [Wolbachia endosymbiont of Drosophila simulans wNo]|uniref:hypothetical protein n=1 Tax=unclassified Wolbachia TaxID=2640676 RepID=UPI0002D25220|nr:MULTISPECIES: hypothetical protein [unclassified Wolbachia]AGJ99402.1 hypothetical protein wNo_10300 [Wolbachia endosymbiont of Drosophila simulans wNo]QCB62588.1 hypothetical protein EJA99_03020 [Wolbachia endosymbiont of Drosophila mauritiana]QCB63635.1 hypothetical protein EJB00_03015 [Wolbachia endosymbiont of Drosophila mauritiana]QWE33083.1 Uncharacterized protein WwMa_01490 [Wolbachia endosymbiont of Drosophila simulans]TGB07789.1 hypothetical protein E5C28_00470 [Wolbachia endosymbi
MINKNTPNSSRILLEKMGIESVEEAEKLLSFKNENDEYLYDSAFKITDLCEDIFIEKVKDTITEQEAKDIYQKALARREFVSRYIENAREMTEPHYRALRVCNIDHDTAEKCDAIIHSLQGE